MDNPIGAMLIQEALATEQDVLNAITIQKEKGGLLGEILIGLGVVSEIALQQTLAKKFQLPFLTADELMEKQIESKLLTRIHKELAYRYLILPLEMVLPQRELLIAVQSPLPDQLCFQLMEQANCSLLRYVLATRDDLNKAVHFHYSKNLHEALLKDSDHAGTTSHVDLLQLLIEGVCPSCGSPRVVGTMQCSACHQPFDKATNDPIVGKIIGSKWKITKQLGMGGMGMVYKGHHAQTKLPVAIKLLKSQFTDKQEARTRFYQEAQIMKQLKHPNITQLYEFGFAEGLSFYLVMEYIDGKNCEEYRDPVSKRFPLHLLPDLVGKVSDAMFFAHDKGVIHRDLKPDNFFLIGDMGKIEEVKILDFGIAKTQDKDQVKFTQTGTTLGTPQYISPEQAMGKDLDHRTDIYSLGVLVFELISGKMLFDAETAFEYMMRHVYTEPTLLSEVCPDLPIGKELDWVVATTLAKSREDRPYTMLEFKEKFLAAYRLSFDPILPENEKIQLRKIVALEEEMETEKTTQFKVPKELQEKETSFESFDGFFSDSFDNLGSSLKKDENSSLLASSGKKEEASLLHKSRGNVPSLRESQDENNFSHAVRPSFLSQGDKRGSNGSQEQHSLAGMNLKSNLYSQPVASFLKEKEPSKSTNYFWSILMIFLIIGAIVTVLVTSK